MPSSRVSSKKASVMSWVSKISLLKLFWFMVGSELNFCFHLFISSFEFDLCFFAFLKFAKSLHITLHRANGVVTDLDDHIACFQSGFLCRPSLRHSITTNPGTGKSIIRHDAHGHSSAAHR